MKEVQLPGQKDPYRIISDGGDVRYTRLYYGKPQESESIRISPEGSVRFASDGYWPMEAIEAVFADWKEGLTNE